MNEIDTLLWFARVKRFWYQTRANSHKIRSLTATINDSQITSARRILPQQFVWIAYCILQKKKIAYTMVNEHTKRNKIKFAVDIVVVIKCFFVAWACSYQLIHIRSFFSLVANSVVFFELLFCCGVHIYLYLYIYRR